MKIKQETGGKGIGWLAILEMRIKKDQRAVVARWPDPWLRQLPCAWKQPGLGE